MEKKINYLIEYLAKLQIKDVSTLFVCILDFLQQHELYSPSKYDLKALKLLAKQSKIELCDDFVLLLKMLDSELQDKTNPNLQEAKKEIFQTLLNANFKKKKEDFDAVETAIYKTLLLYISGLTRSLEIFFIYAKNVQPELYIAYAQTVHQELLSTIFNEQERELLEGKLQEVMGVYLSLYARYLYVL